MMLSCFRWSLIEAHNNMRRACMCKSDVDTPRLERSRDRRTLQSHVTIGVGDASMEGRLSTAEVKGQHTPL